MQTGAMTMKSRMTVTEELIEQESLSVLTQLKSLISFTESMIRGVV